MTTSIITNILSVIGAQNSRHALARQQACEFGEGSAILPRTTDETNTNQRYANISMDNILFFTNYIEKFRRVRADTVAYSWYVLKKSNANNDFDYFISILLF